MQTYSKPALSFEQQIELLKNRGLSINDEERAKRHLSNVSYYRLSAYMLPYKIMQPNGIVTDYFIKGTIWDDIWNLYKFDILVTHNQLCKKYMRTSFSSLESYFCNSTC